LRVFMRRERLFFVSCATFLIFEKTWRSRERDFRGTKCGLRFSGKSF